MGKTDGGVPSRDCRHSHHSAMVDPSRTSAQALLASSHHVSRGNPPQHAIRLGCLLWPEVNLGSVPVHKIFTSTLGVCVDIENLSPNVCRYRNRDRQCSSFTVRTLGTLACKALSASLCRPANAATAG